MIEKLVLGRDEIAGYVCLSVVVFGSRRPIYNASDEVNSYEAVKAVEKIAEI